MRAQAGPGRDYRTAESAPVKSTNRDPNEIVSELTPQPQDIIVLFSKQKPSATAARPATPSACATSLRASGLRSEPAA